MPPLKEKYSLKTSLLHDESLSWTCKLLAFQNAISYHFGYTYFVVYLLSMNLAILYCTLYCSNFYSMPCNKFATKRAPLFSCIAVS